MFKENQFYSNPPNYAPTVHSSVWEKNYIPFNFPKKTEKKFSPRHCLCITEYYQMTKQSIAYRMEYCVICHSPICYLVRGNFSDFFQYFGGLFKLNPHFKGNIYITYLGIVLLVIALVHPYGLVKMQKKFSLSPFANGTQAFTLLASKQPKTQKKKKLFDHFTSEQGVFPIRSLIFLTYPDQLPHSLGLYRSRLARAY